MAAARVERDDDGGSDADDPGCDDSGTVLLNHPLVAAAAAAAADPFGGGEDLVSALLMNKTFHVSTGVLAVLVFVLTDLLAHTIFKVGAALVVLGVILFHFVFPLRFTSHVVALLLVLFCGPVSAGAVLVYSPQEILVATHAWRENALAGAIANASLGVWFGGIPFAHLTLKLKLWIATACNILYLIARLIAYARTGELKLVMQTMLIGIGSFDVGAIAASTVLHISSLRAHARSVITSQADRVEQLECEKQRIEYDLKLSQQQLVASTRCGASTIGSNSEVGGILDPDNLGLGTNGELLQPPGAQQKKIPKVVPLSNLRRQAAQRLLRRHGRLSDDLITHDSDVHEKQVEAAPHTRRCHSPLRLSPKP